jgi:hypothetical protein
LRRRKNLKILWLLLLLCSSVVWASKPTLGLIQPGEYPLVAITNHIPAIYKKPQDSWDSMQKIKLEVGNLGQFRDIPKLGLKNPFVGMIELGDKPNQKFGVIVDIVGEEKRLYVDTDGDGSFAGESWVPLINEWYGSQNYWIIAPEPIKLMVSYLSRPEQRYPLEISVFGALIEAGTIPKMQPFLMIEVRTWFLAKVNEDGAEKLIAIIDHNNNGRFNDKDDQLLIDYNNDSSFSPDEVVTHPQKTALKSGSQKLVFSWDVYPNTLRIGRKN